MWEVASNSRCVPVPKTADKACKAVRKQAVYVKSLKACAIPNPKGKICQLMTTDMRKCLKCNVKSGYRLRKDGGCYKKVRCTAANVKGSCLACFEVKGKQICAKCKKGLVLNKKSMVCMKKG
jgi:hypothetical protein